MKSISSRLRVAGAVGALSIALPMASGVQVSHAAASNHQTLTHLTARGTSHLSARSSTTGNTGGLTDQVHPALTPDQAIPGHGNPNGRVPAAHVPSASSIAVTSVNPGFNGFAGLTHFDSRTAGTGTYTGTQLSGEPPDQMLCTDGTSVLEGVNDVMAAYTTTGTMVSGPTAFSQFWNVAPEIIRNTPPVYGDFISDPRCYYDWQTSRWFIAETQFARDPNTGSFEGPSHIFLAVSIDSTLTDGFYLYSIETTDGTGTTTNHAGCPCFGDQPLIGADANGFYISTNEFPINGPGFNGEQLYAMSKAGLESGTLPTVVQIDNLSLAEGQAYSVQPATTPPGGTYAPANGGTEYFLSALDFTGTTDNRIAVWALTNTSSLNTPSPSVSLTSSIIGSEVYGQPPNAEQRPGATPLRDSLAGKNGNGNGPKQPFELLNSNDDRMNQVVYANGNLYGAVNTAIKPSNGPTRAGIAYFVVSPSSAQAQAGGSMVSQGYVAVNQASVIFPSIAVNSTGQGFMSFTLWAQITTPALPTSPWALQACPAPFIWQEPAKARKTALPGTRRKGEMAWRDGATIPPQWPDLMETSIWPQSTFREDLARFWQIGARS